MLEDGRYEIDPGESLVRIVAHAPGHDFPVSASGVEGSFTVEGDRIIRGEARFPLAKLEAKDPLGQRELRRFLELDRRPIAEGALSSAIPIGAISGRLSAAGRARIRLSGLEKPPAEIAFRVEGTPPRLEARLDASFTAFGFKAPRLLFLKVRDDFELLLVLRVRRDSPLPSGAPGL